jgi:hypothetical protein
VARVAQRSHCWKATKLFGQITGKRGQFLVDLEERILVMVVVLAVNGWWERIGGLKLLMANFSRPYSGQILSIRRQRPHGVFSREVGEGFCGSPASLVAGVGRSVWRESRRGERGAGNTIVSTRVCNFGGHEYVGSLYPFWSNPTATRSLIWQLRNGPDFPIFGAM